MVYPGEKGQGPYSVVVIILYIILYYIVSVEEGSSFLSVEEGRFFKSLYIIEAYVLCGVCVP